MSLFELKQEDIDDVRALISAASLTITANNARRVGRAHAAKYPQDEIVSFEEVGL